MGKTSFKRFSQLTSRGKGMRYAIVSDIHSNLEALKGVLEEIERRGVDDIICLGDLVGYGADPNAVIELALEKGFRCIMGNHDLTACGMEEPYNFNPWAREAIIWTRRVLTEANRQFLKSLSFKLNLSDGCLAVHGSVDSVYDYIFSRSDALYNFDLLKASGERLCFFGHSHYQGVFIKDGEHITLRVVDELAISPERLYLVNPGSVGQPRDGDPRSSFAVYDDGEEKISFIRVDYDIKTAARKILKTGLHPFLAERLFNGM